MVDHHYKFHDRKWTQIVLLSGFCFLLYFFALDRWELRKPDETRYVQVAREIVERGDWISLHLYGKPYVEKPPLFFWLIAYSSYLWQGFTPFSARFPSALFGTLTVLTTFLVGKILYDSKTGFFSGLILATTFLFARFSTRANIDASLTFFTTASLFCFLQWYHWDREGSDKEKKIPSRIIYGFYVGMGLGTLTKGPVGFLLPLMVSLIYLIVREDWEKIRDMRILSGLMLFLAVVLSWYLPAVLKGGRAYLDQTLVHRTIGYYFEGWTHSKPFYFYLRSFPVTYLPWIFFLPGAMVYGFSKETCAKRKTFLFLPIWFIVVFLFFSVSRTKRDLYLLPLFPAASLIIGKFWGDFISGRIEHVRKEWISLPLYSFMGLAFAGAIILGLVSRTFSSYLFYSLPMTCFLIGGNFALIFFYRFKKYGAIFLLIVGMAGAEFLYTENLLFYRDHRFTSAPFLFDELKKEIGLVRP